MWIKEKQNHKRATNECKKKNVVLVKKCVKKSQVVKNELWKERWLKINDLEQRVKIKN